MPLYEAKVRNKTGQIQAMRTQARSENEARSRFRRSGQVISQRKKAQSRFNVGLSDSERQVFFMRLSSMLSSRVGTSQALTIISTTFSGRIQEVAGRILNYVETGSNLDEAIAQVGAPDFSEATVALVRAGSKTGETDKALRDAAAFEYELFNVKKTSSRGLWAGLASFLTAAALTLVSAFYLGPKTMHSDFLKAVNGASGGKVNINWVNTLATTIGWLMAVMLVTGIALWLLASVGRRISPVKVDNLIMKIPFYKDLVLAKNNFIVLYGLELLIRSGINLEEAFRLSAETAPRGALRADLISARDAVKTGQPWPERMKTLHPTDKAALGSAIDKTQISKTMGSLASQYRELYAQRLSSFVPVLNLISALFMSIAGGILFGETILPLLMASKAIMGGGA